MHHHHKYQGLVMFGAKEVTEVLFPILPFLARGSPDFKTSKTGLKINPEQ